MVQYATHNLLTLFPTILFCFSSVKAKCARCAGRVKGEASGDRPSTCASAQKGLDRLRGSVTARDEGGITYARQFDVENRLVAVTSTVTGVSQFVYDGDGNRVMRVDSSGTTVYIGNYHEVKLAPLIVTGHTLWPLVRHIE